MDPQKKIIFGEGAQHPVFMGSIYMKDMQETDAQAAWRFNEAMKSIGFEWMADRRKP